MPFVPVDEVARITVTFTDALGNEAVNVIHFKTDEAPISPTVLNLMLDVVEDWAASDWDVLADASWAMTRLEALNLTAADSYYVDRTINVPGTQVNDPAPSWVTIAISLRSIFSGRSRRGRLYHVGLTEAMCNGDYLSTGYGADLVTRYTALKTAVEAAGYFWGVVSYIEDGVPRSAGLFTPFSSIVLTDEKLDRQVRRRPRD